MAYGNGTATASVGTILGPYTVSNAHGESDRVQAVTLYNNGTVTAYFGQDANVTTSNGIPVLSGASFVLDKQPWGLICAITASGTADIRYWTEVGPTPSRP